MWRLWAKALGEKAGNNDTEADQVAKIRTVLIGYTMLTNTFIIAAACVSIWTNLTVLHIL